jgi:hypothetical protein
MAMSCAGPAPRPASVPPSAACRTGIAACDQLVAYTRTCSSPDAARVAALECKDTEEQLANGVERSVLAGRCSARQRAMRDGSLTWVCHPEPHTEGPTRPLVQRQSQADAPRRDALLDAKADVLTVLVGDEVRAGLDLDTLRSRLPECDALFDALRACSAGDPAGAAEHERQSRMSSRQQRAYLRDHPDRKAEVAAQCKAAAEQLGKSCVVPRFRGSP